jgi:hypothetical protein
MRDQKKGMSVKIGTSARRNSLRVEHMPCIAGDGKPTSSGIAILKTLKSEALLPEEVANKIGQPLFRVRSSLRELKSAGFLDQAEDRYKLSKTREATIR